MVELAFEFLDSHSENGELGVFHLEEAIGECGRGGVFVRAGAVAGSAFGFGRGTTVLRSVEVVGLLLLREKVEHVGWEGAQAGSARAATVLGSGARVAGFVQVFD